MISAASAPGVVGTVVAARLPRASGCVEGDPRARRSRVSYRPLERSAHRPGLRL